MTNLICTLAFKFILESTKKPTTVWRCDGIGYVVPVNSHEFYNHEKGRYEIVADKKHNFFYVVKNYHE